MNRVNTSNIKLNDISAPINKHMTLIKQLNEMMNARWDMLKIADQWSRTADKLTDEDLVDIVGNDLEMLEYTPAQVEDMVPIVVKLIRKQTQ